MSKSNRTTKPVLVKCGNHLISPAAVSRISRVKGNLYVVKFHGVSDTNFPCWIKASEIVALLEHFKIVESEDYTDEYYDETDFN